MPIQWKRSYPLPTPLDRSYVVDRLERVYTPNYDQTPLFKTAGESFILLEWDIVMSREDMAEFESRVLTSPHEIQVLPYKLYGSAKGAYLPSVEDTGTWVHRSVKGVGENPTPGIHLSSDVKAIGESQNWVAYGTPFVHLFGFGAIYFPYEIVREYVNAMFGRPIPKGEITCNPLYPRVTDHWFSVWHWLQTAQRVKCHWDIMPVHLHW